VGEPELVQVRGMGLASGLALAVASVFPWVAGGMLIPGGGIGAGVCVGGGALVQETETASRTARIKTPEIASFFIISRLLIATNPAVP